MKHMSMVAYRYRQDLRADDLRDLTKEFSTVGNSPGVVAHFSRLDGQGGFVLQEDSADTEKAFEVTLRYAPWIEFEVFPVATMEEAFPVIQRVYG